MSLSDHVKALAVRTLSRLPPRAQYLLSLESPLVIDGQTLDPMVQLVRRYRMLMRQPGLLEPDYLTARFRFRREMLPLLGPKTPVAAVRDLEVDGGAGKLRARSYASPNASAGGPLLVYLHGGGFVVGDLDVFDEACRLICVHAGMHVLSVDYRLAPEHPFPAALEDTRAALRWARANAASLGADPQRVAIGGDSAGANLATVAARLDTRDGIPVYAQLLFYPPTDAATDYRSEELFGKTFFLDTRDRDTCARLYAEGTGVSEVDPRTSPLRAPDLGGLPPALIVIAGFDILRDEGEAYAEALRAAGTPVRVHREPSLPHGFANMTGFVPAARQAVIAVAREFRGMLDEIGNAPGRATGAVHR